jgi:DNA replication protein DnaD
MKPGDLSNLIKLSRCYMRPYSFEWTLIRSLLQTPGWPLSKIEKHYLRKWMHEYRHQLRFFQRRRAGEIPQPFA